jgi:prepilin-type N-terminal cleavage/methylation domain-containing protein
MKKSTQTGFTLVEVAIVLLIVGILLGYTVALFPRQQELKQYRAVDRVMDQVIEAVIGFAQVNGRLPCPTQPNLAGVEDIDGAGCNTYAGFVPVNTLGLDGRFNEDKLLIDPWGNPYRYYVTHVDFNGNGQSDFVTPGEMRLVGLVDSEPDTWIDLDGRYMICTDAGTATNDRCTGAAGVVFGRFKDDFNSWDRRYAGAPFVLLSMGKNWSEAAPEDDELENSGATEVTGTSGTKYLLKDVAAGKTNFVKRTTGFADKFDDVVRWASPSVLYSRMIQAGQLP